MRFDVARERLARLPPVLPPAPSELDPFVLGRPPELDDAVRPAMSGQARDAAALVLLYPDADGEALVVLTVRPTGRHAHAGQVALPGGKREDGDAFPEGTALREAAEEVGLDAARAGVTTLGVLGTVDVRVSGFLMVPVLAVARHVPHLVADPVEVAAVLRVPVRHFLPGAVIEVVEEDRAGWRLRYGAFPIGGYHVWGATARVLGQLGAVLGPG